MSPPERQVKLKVYTDALQRLADKGLAAAIVIAYFNRWRVLPLMERKLPLFKMTEGAPPEGTQMVAEPLSDEVAAQRAGKVVSHPRLTSGTFGGSRCAPTRGTSAW